MSSIISIGTIDKNIIFPIIQIIFIVIDNIVINHTSLLDNLFNHIFMRSICQSCGRCIALIPFLILSKESKKLDENKKFGENIINLEENNKKFDENIRQSILINYKKNYIELNKKLKKKKMMLILLSSFIEFSNSFTFFKLYFINGFNFYIFDIIFLSVYSYYLLKVVLYQHQYFSMITIIVFGLIQNIIIMICDENNYLKIILRIFNEVVFCLNIVINKYAMDKTFCSEYELCFYKGAITLVAYIISFTIISNVEIKTDYYTVEYKGKYYIDNFYHYINSLNAKEIFVFILQMIYYFVYNLFILITIKNYTACHSLIIFIFYQLSVDHKEKWRIFVDIIIFIIILFMLLIFNEVIELNFYGLQKNTKKNIRERAKIEILENNNNSQLEKIPEVNNDFDDEFDEAKEIEIDGFKFELIDYKEKK